MRPARYPPRGQRGLSLMMTLIMLVATSLIGVTLVQSSLFQERIAGSHRNLDTAFQAAEAALRDAETDLLTVRLPAGDVTLAAAASCTSSGACLPSDEGGTPIWKSVNWTAAPSVAYGAQTGVAALPVVAAQPRYIIEPIQTTVGVSLKGKPCYAYRITARGVGGDATGVATTQSTAFYSSLCK